jgi:hypothetical protein
LLGVIGASKVPASSVLAVGNGGTLATKLIDMIVFVLSLKSDTVTISPSTSSTSASASSPSAAFNASLPPPHPVWGGAATVRPESV